MTNSKKFSFKKFMLAVIGVIVAFCSIISILPLKTISSVYAADEQYTDYSFVGGNMILPYSSSSCYVSPYTQGDGHGQFKIVDYSVSRFPSVPNVPVKDAGFSFVDISVDFISGQLTSHFNSTSDYFDPTSPDPVLYNLEKVYDSDYVYLYSSSAQLWVDDLPLYYFWVDFNVVDDSNFFTDGVSSGYFSNVFADYSDLSMFNSNVENIPLFINFGASTFDGAYVTYTDIVAYMTTYQPNTLTYNFIYYDLRGNSISYKFVFFVPFDNYPLLSPRTNYFKFGVDSLYQEGYNAGNLAGYNAGQTAGYNAGVSAGQTIATTQSYNNGYAAGQTAGYNNGYTAGYSAGDTAGQQTGYNAGQTDGYNSGYSAGYSAGDTAGQQIGYNAGQSAGYNQGYTAGNTAGQQTGYNVGYSDGVSSSQSDSYNQGYSSGYDAGNTAGYNAGNTAGYNNGYSAGATAGYQEGYYEGLSSDNPYTFNALFGSVLDAPVQTLTGLFNFELLGVNLLGLFTGLLTLAVIIWIVKLALGGK